METSASATGAGVADSARGVAEPLPTERCAPLETVGLRGAWGLRLPDIDPPAAGRSLLLAAPDLAAGTLVEAPLARLARMPAPLGADAALVVFLLAEALAGAALRAPLAGAGSTPGPAALAAVLAVGVLRVLGWASWAADAAAPVLVAGAFLVARLAGP